jgi:hypothetical protein
MESEIPIPDQVIQDRLKRFSGFFVRLYENDEIRVAYNMFKGAAVNDDHQHTSG